MNLLGDVGGLIATLRLDTNKLPVHPRLSIQLAGNLACTSSSYLAPERVPHFSTANNYDHILLRELNYYYVVHSYYHILKKVILPFHHTCQNKKGEEHKNVLQKATFSLDSLMPMLMYQSASYRASL